MTKSKTRNIAIFASGSGSNAEKIIEYFEGREDISITCIYTNKKTAKVLQRADNHGVASHVFNRDDFYESNNVIEDLISRDIDLIVLAGFLWLIPASLIEAFPHRIINIHPSLLPKYGGKGMYGKYVHKAVSESGDTESGITVHFVNSEFDKGKVISQIRCFITPYADPQEIADRVLKVEHEYFPIIIDELLDKPLYSKK